MTIPATTVGIVGAGTMGQGIAHTCAAAGCEVLLYDVNQEFATRALGRINATLKTLVEKGKVLESDADHILSKIQLANRLDELQCDFVIEAVVEELDIKRKIFSELEDCVDGSAILLTNTSSIPVTLISEALARAERFAGLHFFNPAPVMKLVEVVRGSLTSSETVERTIAFASSIGKTAVVTQDSPGFIVNRVARLFYVEALKALEDGTATHEAVDALMRNAGFRMGPFELMDLIGVDVNLSVTKSIHDAFGHERFRPSRIQEEKVKHGLLGRKSGKGFYDYE